MNYSDAMVYLVDDDASILQALSRLLRATGFQVLTFDTAHRFLERHDPSVPGCLVLDLAMPGLNGLQLQEKLAAAGEPLPVIFLTGQADVPATVNAMKRGAADFLTKPVDRDALLSAVRTAIERDRSTRVAERELTEIRERLQSLTPRQYDVFQHVISGKLNKQTAADIGVAEKTVKAHRARMMEKMKVESVAELVRFAEKLGIEPVPLDQPGHFNSSQHAWD
jgi:FixJ family two-component response regulator